jgi:hypothetical protein
MAVKIRASELPTLASPNLRITCMGMKSSLGTKFSLIPVPRER